MAKLLRFPLHPRNWNCSQFLDAELKYQRVIGDDRHDTPSRRAEVHTEAEKSFVLCKTFSVLNVSIRETFVSETFLVQIFQRKKSSVKRVSR